MNHIKKLQFEKLVAEKRIELLEEQITGFVAYLSNNPKFQGEEIIEGKKERKDWISTSDVIKVLQEIKQKAWEESIDFSNQILPKFENVQNEQNDTPKA